ncbi:DUF4468 domain-containing protein [Moraxella nasibovis]|uniref:DUF4468 domain-containing protein n=1 Tax=Moraxella nasibovis TaxID=2904120 RepID=UPI00240F132B|nr:DUF4468 domain-containing protein [Moraxella nasibovis]WFF39295.1 DUF4468 domain-containing protein [Moraxella nasibovis]
MKKLLIAGVFGLSLVGCATTSGTVSEPMNTYQRIVDVPNVKQDMVYEGSRQWVAKNFKSANSVIQYQDKETGSVIGKGNMSYPCSFLRCSGGTSPVLQFTFQVDSKDNRARVSFSDLTIHTPSAVSPITGIRSPEMNEKVIKENDKTQTKAILDKVIDDLAQDIASPSVGSKDW